MNYGEMLTQIRLLLGETDSDNSYWSETEINTQINLSNLRVATDFPVLLTYSEVATTADQARYGLPTDFLQLKDIQMYLGDNTTDERRKLHRLEYDEFEDMVGGNVNMTGQPAWYRIEFGAVSTTASSPPGDVWLYPVPDDNGGDDYTLRLAYYQKPTALSVSIDVSELPEFMHLLVVYHSAWYLSLKDDNQSKINNLAAMYRDERDKVRMVHLKRDRSGGKQVRTPYGGSSLIGQGKIIRRGPIR
jgi:hypothetical protein